MEKEKFQTVVHLVASVQRLNNAILNNSSIAESDVIRNASMRLDTIMKRLNTGQIRAGVVGLTKAGKSTTLNALLGKQFLPGSIQPQTAKEVSIVHADDSDGELYGAIGNKRVPLGKGHQAIHDRLVEFNEASRKYAHSSYDKLYLHASLRFLADKVQGVQFELSDTPGLGEAASHHFSFESELAVRDMCAFVMIMKLDFLKTKSESDLLLKLSTLHPKLFINLNRILILVNAYELSYEDKSKHNLQADEIQEYISNFLREPNVLGKVIPPEHIIPFSALWGLRARLWSDNPEILLNDPDARNLYKEAMIKLDRAGYHVKSLEGERNVEKVRKLSLLLEDFSRITHVESNLTHMLYNHGGVVLLESSVDDTLSVVDDIRAEVSQMLVRENVVKKMKVVESARNLLTSFKSILSKYINVITELEGSVGESTRAIIETLADALEESLNSLINGKLYETLQGTVEHEQKDHVQSQILLAKSSVLSPAVTKMRIEWLKVIESIHKTAVDRVKVILSELKVDLMSCFGGEASQSSVVDEAMITHSHKVATLTNEKLTGLSDIVVSFVPHTSRGNLQLQLTYEGQGSEKVEDAVLKERLIQGKKTKYDTKEEKQCFGLKYGFFGPKNCVHITVAKPYDVATYSPDFAALQSDFSGVVKGWIKMFTSEVDNYQSEITGIVANEFTSAVKTALSLPTQQLEEDVHMKEAVLDLSNANVAFLNAKKNELNDAEMDLDNFLKKLLE